MKSVPILFLFMYEMVKQSFSADPDHLPKEEKFLQRDVSVDKNIVI